MPKRKDPVIPVRVAVASCKWMGATAEEVEQLITRPIEQAMAQNQAVKPPSGSDYGVRSLSFPNFALVFVQLDENVKDTVKFTVKTSSGTYTINASNHHRLNFPPA